MYNHKEIVAVFVFVLNVTVHCKIFLCLLTDVEEKLLHCDIFNIPHYYLCEYNMT